jgi:FtsP/CotA-like multicopper oxidase with cupredoxin domain
LAAVLGLLGPAAACGTERGAAAEGKTRTYFIAADPVDWDYAPNGQKLGPHFDAHAGTFLDNGDNRIGKVNRKSVYRAYTDESFTTLAPVSEQWKHLGLLGPVIHAVVGDTVRVFFKNHTPYPASMHPHGFLYEKSSEGAAYADGASGESPPGGEVPPGGAYTYTWQVPERAGPGPMDPSSVMWAYHSHSDEVTDTNAGLAGPIVVTAKGKANPDGSPAGVDRELFALYNIYDENQSPWLDYNVEHFPKKPGSVKKDDPGFVESNLKHSINGYLFGNLPGLDLKRGQHVRWYVMGAGTETGLHTPHWHGNTGLSMGMRVDTVELLPMSMKIVDMVPDAPGNWLFHCHINDHIVGGMDALYSVK